MGERTIAINRVPPEPVGCKRRDILQQLQKTLEELDDKHCNYPMPRALLRGEQCPSRAPPQHGLVRYLPTAYLDGSAGKPFMINDEGKVKWTPKYPKQCQNPHPNMTCYCVPQVFNPELCECPEADAVAGKAKNSTVGQGDKDYCTSGKDVYHCPMDPNHSHWSPHIGSCQAPKPCKAQCFDHSDQRDWVNVVPNYKMYLQAEDTTF